MSPGFSQRKSELLSPLRASCRAQSRGFANTSPSLPRRERALCPSFSISSPSDMAHAVQEICTGVSFSLEQRERNGCDKGIHPREIGSSGEYYEDRNGNTGGAGQPRKHEDFSELVSGGDGRPSGRRFQGLGWNSTMMAGK